MNLWFRLLWLAFAARRRPPVTVLEPCRTPFRVVPTDLDVLRHMNNGVYFSLMDLARVDLMHRAGVYPLLRERGWYPVIAAETIQIRRSLLLFQRFSIVTRLVTWDERSMLLEQTFERGGEAVARAYVRSRFLAKGGGSVAIADLLAVAGIPFEPAPTDVPEAALRWFRDSSTWAGAPAGRSLGEPASPSPVG